jgi:hypothetical protein
MGQHPTPLGIPQIRLFTKDGVNLNARFLTDFAVGPGHWGLTPI